MAPVSLPPKIPSAPPIGGTRQAPDAQERSRAAGSEAFEPASYRRVERSAAPAAAQTAAAAAETRHTYTLQTLSAYAGVLVGQIERSVTPPGTASTPAQGPPQAPGSRLNIKV